MRTRISSILRFVAKRLHGVASTLDKRAYRLDHGGERLVVSDSPLAGLLAEIRDSIRDRELNAGQRGEGVFPVASGEVNGHGAEDVAHQVDGHALSHFSAVDARHLYLSWLKFIEHRPGWERAHAQALKRLSSEERAALQQIKPPRQLYAAQ